MSFNEIKEPIFGNWYIDEQIGSGAFGTVYKIKREDFGKTYYSALKVISVPQNESELQSVRSELGDDRSVSEYYNSFTQDFAKEIEVMSELKGNSNIVSFEDHAFIPNKNGFGSTILIRMELLTPFNKFALNNSFKQIDIVKLGIDISTALEICERKNIIHRDIKPDNIFISDDGRYELGDFGIARELEKTMGGLSKKGTYSYMAPEVYKGDPYNHTVDIYSLGLVLYKLLNHNRTPFLPEFPAPITFLSKENALRMRMSGEKIPFINGVPESLNIIVCKACAYNSKDRFQSATELKQALIAVLNGDELDEKFNIEPESIKTDITNLMDGNGSFNSVENSSQDLLYQTSILYEENQTELLNQDNLINKPFASSNVDDETTTIIDAQNELKKDKKLRNKKNKIIIASVASALAVLLIIIFAPYLIYSGVANSYQGKNFDCFVSFNDIELHWGDKAAVLNDLESKEYKISPFEEEFLYDDSSIDAINLSLTDKDVEKCLIQNIYSTKDDTEKIVLNSQGVSFAVGDNVKLAFETLGKPNSHSFTSLGVQEFIFDNDDYFIVVSSNSFGKITYINYCFKYCVMNFSVPTIKDNVDVYVYRLENERRLMCVGTSNVVVHKELVDTNAFDEYLEDDLVTDIYVNKDIINVPSDYFNSRKFAKVKNVCLSESVMHIGYNALPQNNIISNVTVNNNECVIDYFAGNDYFPSLGKNSKKSVKLYCHKGSTTDRFYNDKNIKELKAYSISYQE